MSKLVLIQSGEAVQAHAYADTSNIGQAACARIRLGIAQDGLRKSSARLLSTEYEPEITLPMWVRMHKADRADYDRARAVLGVTS